MILIVSEALLPCLHRMHFQSFWELGLISQPIVRLLELALVDQPYAYKMET